MNIEKIIIELNNGSTVEDQANIYGVSKRTLQRKIKDNDYIYNRKECKYFKQLENAKIEKLKNDETDKYVTRTYTIQEEVYNALRAKGFFENIDMSQIVNNALKSYIDKKYYNINS